MKRIIFLLVTFLALPLAHASQEGVLELSSFELESRGIGSSGPVTVLALKNDAGEYIYLAVKAFGKEYNLEKKHFKKISGIPFNGIQLSYETGYRQTGGRTVYILFQKGFASGTEEKTLLIVKEDGSVSIEQ